MYSGVGPLAESEGGRQLAELDVVGRPFVEGGHCCRDLACPAIDLAADEFAIQQVQTRTGEPVQPVG